MFKRLMSLFGNNAEKDAATAVPPAPTTSSAPAELEQEAITAYDVQGNEVKISRSEWRDKVLLPNLAEKAHDPDALYQLIMTALNDGFEKDLMPAAKQLLAIDTLPERGHTVHGIVLLANGKLEEAEATLREGMAKVGETATLLTNLAKVIWETGDLPKAREILSRAVQIAPNLENGLMWWLEMIREAEGNPACLVELKRLAGISGAWRAQLLLAEKYLAQQETAAAISLYQNVLSQGIFDQDTLLRISSTLGSHEQLDVLINLLQPVYQPEQHDPRVGLNLLQAFQDLRRTAEGKELVAIMSRLDLGPYTPYLAEFERSFANMQT